ncbi:MAG: chemotaxis protein CheW [Granulosicoccus sp.]|nr:chemotaxis protein CheW [Granulosicoccus sp.]
MCSALQTNSGADSASNESDAIIKHRYVSIKENTEQALPVQEPPCDSYSSEKNDISTADKAKVLDTYGSFAIGDTEFALSAQSIQEVVNDPQCYSAIPLSPDYLLGVFSLRGSIIPVIDMRAIFKMETSSTSHDEVRKVAIVEHGELSIGLIFDSTSEVFNDQECEKCVFDSRADTPAQQIVSGVFRFQNGQRIVQILDVPAMLRLDKVPQSLKKRNHSIAQKRGERRQCISFLVGNSCCGLDIGAIREILNVDEIGNRVLAGGLCLGAINLRGDTVPIVDFSKLLGFQGADHNAAEPLDSHKVIVTTVDNQLIGLLVQSIESIVGYFEDELIEFPVLVDKKQSMFRGCVPAKSNSDHTIVLKHDDILSVQELAEITRGHSELFNESENVETHVKRKSMGRETLLTFSLEGHFGFNINDVSEVIESPEELIETPGMASHIRGMASVRGELIAVIDSRKLYSMASMDAGETSKLLVFEKSGTKYGLIVDTVDSIVQFHRSDVIEVPKVVFGQSQNDINKDVKEAVIVKSGETEQTVCILDLEAVCRRANA